jgi:hypothetical protein
MSTSAHHLQSLLEEKTGRKLKIKINDNRSTMVSVRWDPGCTKVSLHRIFLEAPKNVMEELACYIKDKREISPLVKSYIQEGLNRVDYSETVDANALETTGQVYDLLSLYQKVEEKYFPTPLGLRITWFGKRKPTPSASLVLGQYQRLLQLIRIHRVLDRKDVPQEVLEYVIYHEMVHHIHLPKITVGGRSAVHHDEFKRQERAFHGFDEIQQWIRKERGRFFQGRKNGWS